MGSFQIDERQTCLLCAGRRMAVRGEVGDVSCHEVSLSPGVSRTSQGLKFQLENHSCQGKHTDMLLVHKEGLDLVLAFF